MQSESRVRRSARVDSDSFDSSESEYSESELEEEEEEEEEEDSDDESFWVLSCLRHLQDVTSADHAFDYQITVQNASWTDEIS